MSQIAVDHPRVNTASQSRYLLTGRGACQQYQSGETTSEEERFAVVERFMRTVTNVDLIT